MNAEGGGGFSSRLPLRFDVKGVSRVVDENPTGFRFLPLG